MKAQARVHQYPVIRRFMTPAPHTIGRNQTLAVAERMMRDHDIRHLPVLEGGEIVGMLSHRDVLFVEALPGTRPAEILVEEAMVETVVSASPDTPLAEAVEEMARRKIGSTVVTEGGHVVGVFTTTDALNALAELLSAEG